METTRHDSFKADATNDPLIGTQEHPDDAAEYKNEPDSEAAPLPTHGWPIKSHVIAGVLGLFFGWLGLHRFYLGFRQLGFFQLGLFLVCFVPVVIYGLATHMPVQSFLLVGASTAALVWVWGAVEGAMILNGMMAYDGHGHPLR